MFSTNSSVSPIAGLFSFVEPASGLSPINIASTTLALLSAGIIASFVYPALFKSRDGVYELGGFSVLTAWPFFTRRYDFLWQNFKVTGEKIFRFKVLQHSVVAMRGEEARKTFFGEKSFDFTEGYKILMGASPRLEDINIEEEITKEGVSAFNKRLLAVLRKDRLTDMLPTLFADINRRMLNWGKEGKINPFKDVYDLVFQMTVRMATCAELADDEAAVTRLAETYWKLEKSATPVALLLPWFPGPAKKAKEESTKTLFTMLSHYVDLRKKAEVQSADAIDMLLQDGCDEMTIIQFVLSVVFAGVINTGINSCWDMLYLGAHPEWKKRVVDEVNSLVEKYTSPSEPVHKRLAAIPISAWEDEMPAMDLVIRETLRLTLTNAALRRNIEEEITVEGKVLRKGDFLAYSVADAHLNPEIYTDPMMFDPSRYEEGREEDKKGTFAFLGWGAGRHPCTGMKVAKLEIKIIVAMFLVAYDFELVDASGKFPKSLPEPDRNDIQQARPMGEPCYIKFKRIMD